MGVVTSIFGALRAHSFKRTPLLKILDPPLDVLALAILWALLTVTVMLWVLLRLAGWTDHEYINLIYLTTSGALTATDTEVSTRVPCMRS